MSTAKPKFKPVKTAKIVLTENACTQNILQQNFDQKEINAVWVSDFTYLKAGGKFVYLCVILDLFSRKVIAYGVSQKIDTNLAISTLQKAIDERKPKNPVIFHTDRGSQYTSEAFRKEADRHGLIQSFSAAGHPYDNAVMECFFKYLKKEETNRRNYATMEEINLSLFKYIHSFYNLIRPHSHNGGLSPNNFEKLL